MRKYLHYHHDMCNPARANKVRVDEARKDVPHFLVHFVIVFILFNFIYVVHGFCLSHNQKKLENEKLCCFMSEMHGYFVPFHIPHFFPLTWQLHASECASTLSLFPFPA